MENGVKFIFHGIVNFKGMEHGLMNAFSHFHVHRRRGHLKQGKGIVRIKGNARLIRRQKIIHKPLFRNVNRFKGVGNKKSVNDHHHRQIHNLCQAKGKKGGIQGLLAVFAIQLYPSGVPLGQGITLVHPDVPSRPQGPVHLPKDNGKSGTGRPVEHLVHQGKPMGRGGGEGTNPGTCCPHNCGHGRVFAFHWNKLCLHFTTGTIFRNGLNDVGLGGNGIS